MFFHIYCTCISFVCWVLGHTKMCKEPQIIRSNQQIIYTHGDQDEMKAARGPSQRDKSISYLGVQASRWLLIIQERRSVIQELEIKLMLRSDRDSGWRCWPESRHKAQSRSLSMGRSTWGGGAGRGGAGATGRNFVGIQVLRGGQRTQLFWSCSWATCFWVWDGRLSASVSQQGGFYVFPELWICLEIRQTELAGASLGWILSVNHYFRAWTME